jgi:hypothetical protein
MLHAYCIVHVLGSTPGPPMHGRMTHVFFHAGIFIMDPELNQKPFTKADKARFMMLFSVEELAKGKAKGDLEHAKWLADTAEAKAKADLEDKPEDDEGSDDSQRTMPYKPEEEEHSGDSQRTIPYKPEDDEHPDAEQPAIVPVPVQPSCKRPRSLLADQDMKDSCSRFNKEMRAKRKPCCK